jgi:hypothetical protein
MDAAICFSADIVFRFLPSLMELVLRISPSGSLHSFLLDLAGRWPLSSVGISGVQPALRALEAIAGHPALATLYADRVLLSSDVSRLGSTWLDARIRDAAGAYPDLLPPDIRAALEISPS